MNFVSVIDANDIERVNALRLAEYAKTSGFSVKPAGILWNRSDDQCTVLGAWDGRELVSTMRVELIRSRELVEQKIECPWDFPVALDLPVVILSKAATRETHRGGGYNALLRYWSFVLARSWGATQMLGTLVAGSPRERTMREMGYVFFENSRGWCTTNYRSTAPVLVASLDLATRADQALDVCARVAGPLIEQYAWQGALPEPRFVEVVR
jgi:hypothetical protein